MIRIFIFALISFSASAKNFIIEQDNLKYQLELIPEVRDRAVSLYLEMENLGSLMLLENPISGRLDNFKRDLTFSSLPHTTNPIEVKENEETKSNQDYLNCLIAAPDSTTRELLDTTDLEKIVLSSELSKCHSLVENGYTPAPPEQILFLKSTLSHLVQNSQEKFKEFFIKVLKNDLEPDLRNIYQSLMTMIAYDAQVKNIDDFDLESLKVRLKEKIAETQRQLEGAIAEANSHLNSAIDTATLTSIIDQI